MTRYRVMVACAWVFFVAAVLLAVLGAVAPSFLPGIQRGSATLLTLFFATILLGATVHVYESDDTSRMVDVGGTAALALCISFELPGVSVRPGVPAIIAVVAAGLIGGGIVASWSSKVGLPGILARTMPRILTVTALASLFHGRWGDSTLIGVVQEQHPIVRASVLFVVVFCALVVEAPIWAELSDRRTDSRRTAHLAALRESLTLGVVPTSTAVLVAVAEPILGLLALPLLLLPLVFNQLAVRRHEELRRHSRQSVQALSRMPEAMGLVRSGHAARVAEVAVDIGRQLDLGRREIARLERAALLHDLGQVRLTAPVPGGATILAAPADQEHIAAGAPRLPGRPRCWRPNRPSLRPSRSRTATTSRTRGRFPSAAASSRWPTPTTTC